MSEQTEDQLIQIAVQHHQAGRLPQAEEGYRRILLRNPHQADALQLLGALLHQQGNNELALDFIGRAIRIDPSNPFVLDNLGTVYQALNRLDEAENCYRKAFALEPAHAGAIFNLGNVLKKRGQMDQAVSCYRQALALRPDFVDAHIILGNTYKEMGSLNEAIACYQKSLEFNPSYAEVHFNLGLVFQQRGDLDKAVNSYRKALALKPDYVEIYNNFAAVLRRQGKLDEVCECFQKVLLLRPHLAESHGNLGSALLERGQPELAIEYYRQALLLKPDHAETLSNMGSALKELGRLDEAIDCYNKALALKADSAEVHNNLGTALKQQDKLDAALASYRTALALKPDYAEAHNNLALALHEQGKADEAIEHYRKAITHKADYAEAHNNLGNALENQGLLDAAINSYHTAIARKPDYADAYNNLANTLKKQGKLSEAIERYRKALSLKPDFAFAYHNLGCTLLELKRYEDAAAQFHKALSLKPDCAYALGLYLHCVQHCCDWDVADDIARRVLAEIDAGSLVSDPFNLLTIPATPAQQKRCAEIFLREKYPEARSASGIAKPYSHDKIRLGYFSADFHNHATAYLMAELLEQHDRNKFEVIGFSFGTSPNDKMHQRIRAAFDRFLDVRKQSDQEIAALAKEMEIDIAIDLKGYTSGSRTGIFALRPAPIQVNYLGYPGTMGAPYIDYLIADPTLVPVEHQQHYSEKIVYLPDSYQVNDSHRRISKRQFTRREVGLPDKGFVFCCFNNNYKITPAVFDIWMQLLRQVEGSVLWLFEGNARAGYNLRNEAKKRGIAPERLVFAPHMDLPDHLARHRLADLFLDTFFCNAHTTASDALWARLPVLTCLGDTFAGRVAASLLCAIGLPELIAHTPGDYQTLALELAMNREQLASLKQRLAVNRSTHPLFDTKQFSKHIEDAFTQMWERYQGSLLPDHIYVQTSSVQTNLT